MFYFQQAYSYVIEKLWTEFLTGELNPQYKIRAMQLKGSTVKPVFPIHNLALRRLVTTGA